MITQGSAMRTTIDDLSERIAIVYRVRARNSCGDIIDGNEIVRCTVWAKILPTSTTTETDGIERKAAVSYRIIVRYNRDILPDDEILWNGKRLIQTATPYDAESRHVWTVLECREAVQDGKAQPLSG